MIKISNIRYNYTREPAGWLTHEVVVPRALRRRHEEAKEAVRQQHLDLLVVRRQVALGIVAGVLVLTTPFIAAWSQLVRSQRARARSETAHTVHAVHH